MLGFQRVDCKIVLVGIRCIVQRIVKLQQPFSVAKEHSEHNSQYAPAALYAAPQGNAPASSQQWRFTPFWCRVSQRAAT